MRALVLILAIACLSACKSGGGGSGSNGGGGSGGGALPDLRWDTQNWNGAQWAAPAPIAPAGNG